jgi:UDPglucose--hexose-1-phosphate uridylyltransferase
VLIFENRGAMIGASNPHPHGQIWANQRLPNEAVRELHQQQRHGTRNLCLLCSYLAIERREGERIVCQNDHFVVLVPFWAVWPFETLVLPRRHHGTFPDLTEHECEGLADILGRLAPRYDNLFAFAFPYSMGFHQRPPPVRSTRMASARPLLPAVAALRHRAQVRGRL